MALVYLGLDDTEQALDWLEKACDERGLLVVANPHNGKKNRRYKRSEGEALEPLFSKRLGKQTGAES